MIAVRWALAAALPFAALAADDQVCAGCHRDVVTRFRNTPMAKALVPVADCEILRNNPSLTHRDNGYESRITREGNRSVLTVSGGGKTVTANLLWAFGRGQAGQTYVFERDGTYYESRVSFYNALRNIDVTMGAQSAKPADIEEAAGHRMGPRDAMECFGCHSTGAVSGGRLHLESIVPGVGCTSCHAGAEKHATAASAGDSAAAKVARLGASSAEEMSELCGRCHRTWSQIAMNGPRGVLNVRFQPYRLTNSKCYSVTDARIRCSACHDPHGALETAGTAYDSKCASCHSIAAHTKTCPVAKQNCVSCHMPKVELPGAHARFTDHQIRVVRPGESYPNE
jgi:hypothetical protein